MRDDVIAAFEWFDEFQRRERLWRRGAGLAAPEIELVSAWLFHPADPQERPFAWVQDLFNYRLKLLEENKDDVRAYIIKLALNSLYGKFAQRVGERGNPPKFAAPVFAAAITAATRRKLSEAALTRPDDIIAFATDGVYSTKTLDVYVPDTKTLGLWEKKVLKEGGVFVLAGVNSTGKDKGKTRGFSPNK